MSTCRLRELDFVPRCPFQKHRKKGNLCLEGCPIPHEHPKNCEYTNDIWWEALKFHCCRTLKCVEKENQKKMEKKISEEKKTETLETHSLGKNPNDTLECLISEADGDN